MHGGRRIGRRVGTLALLFAIGATGAARAQSAGLTDTLALSLDGALARGLDRNEDVGLARSRVGGARARAALAKTALLPRIDHQLSYQRNLKNPISAFTRDSAWGEVASAFVTGQKNSHALSLTATQSVFDAPARLGLKAAHTATEVEELRLTERELDIGLEIVQAYYGAELAGRTVDITAAAIAQADAQLRQVRLTHAAGNASELEVLSVQVQRGNLEPQRIDALNARDQAILNLKRLIDLPAGQPIRLTDQLDPDRLQPLAASRIDSIVAGATTRRPELKAASGEIAIGTLQLAAAKARILPVVAVGASLAKQASGSRLIPEGDAYHDNWSVAFSVQVPIFDGGRRRADMAAAREQTRSAELTFAKLTKAVSLDVAQQRSELERAQAAIVARGLTVAQAARTHDLTTIAYAQGLTTSLVLSDARLQLRQARLNEAQAVHDYYVALARLQRAAGQLPAVAARVATN